MGASFILIYKQPTDPAALLTALKFFDWAYKSGGDMAMQLDYVPMPANVVQMVQKTWAERRSRAAAAAALAISRGPLRNIRAWRSCGNLGDGPPCGGPSSVRECRSRMANVTLNDAIPAAAPQHSGRKQQLQDSCSAARTEFFALCVLLLLGGVIVSLVIGAWPALSTFGLGFVVTEVWNPVTDKFGAWAPIYGTIVTSLIAMMLGVPVSFGIAMFITELCPAVLKRPLGIAIELLAGIPSIIYGIWGLFVLAPVLQQTVQPFLINTIGQAPLIGSLFAGPPYGIGTFTAGIILAIMVLPFITSITRDVFETVPPMLKESAYGLGATTWEVVWKVVLPYTRVGVIGAVMLGLGRALGETMAVTFVIGNAPSRRQIDPGAGHDHLGHHRQ